jgi:hypothetical protein
VTRSGATLDDLRTQLAASPALCPLQWNDDRSAVLFGRFSEDAYREVSFFDGRAIPQAEQTGVVPWSMIEPWLVQLPRSCDFLFHISHCGSTLLSRLLGSHSACLALREPGILRGLTCDDSTPRIDATVGLVSRVFHPAQRTLVKATSVVNAVALRLLEATSDGKALLVFVPAEIFLTSVLDGSRSDIEAHAASRWQRLAADGLTAPVPGCAGEHAAAAWLCEMRGLQRLAVREPDRTRWVDFEQFLDDPARSLAGMAGFLGHSLDARGITEGPLMRRYAKRPDVAYDIGFRRRLLSAARENHADEIASGLAWLDHLASDVPRPTVTS